MAFRAEPIVWIEVRGPVTVQRFASWMLEPAQRDMRHVTFGGSGPTFYHAGYEVPHAERIVAWLKEHGGPRETL